MSSFDSRLGRILNEDARLRPATVTHKNGKVFEAQHVRVVRGKGGMSIVVLGFDPGPRLEYSLGSRNTLVSGLPDFCRRWYTKVEDTPSTGTMRYYHQHGSRYLKMRVTAKGYKFRKILTMSQDNVTIRWS